MENIKLYLSLDQAKLIRDALYVQKDRTQDAVKQLEAKRREPLTAEKFPTPFMNAQERGVAELQEIERLLLFMNSEIGRIEQ